jgi:Caspase domain
LLHIRELMATDDHAVVVGISRYAHFEDLEGPENDTRAIIEWLRDPAGGDVPMSQIYPIKSSEYPKEDRPVSGDVYMAFEKLIEIALDKNPRPAGRRLYIFMAGHGFAPALRDAALLMANAKAQRWGHNVSGAAVADHFAQSFFEEVVLLMDCCRSEIVGLAPNPLPWQPVISGQAGNPRWLYAFATCFSRAAREKLIDGEMRGVFTMAVLEALRSGSLTSKTIEPLVVARMSELMGEDKVQIPHFQPSPDELEFGPPLVKPALNITLALDAGEADVSVGRGGSAPPIDTQRLRGGETWRIELATGLYEIVRQDIDGSSSSSIVKLTMGDRDVTV